MSYTIASLLFVAVLVGVCTYHLGDVLAAQGYVLSLRLRLIVLGLSCLPFVLVMFEPAERHNPFMGGSVAPVFAGAVHPVATCVAEGPK